MSSYVSPAAVTLIGMLISNLLYGVFVVLFCITSYLYSSKDRGPKPNYFLLTASGLIFLFTTAFLITASSRTYAGLVADRHSVDPDVFFLELNTESFYLQVAFLYMNTLVADATMIYRCWVVWNYRWRMIALNLALWPLTVASVIVIGVLSAREQPNDWDSLLAVDTWNIVFLTVSLAQNVVTTSLIAFRLWRVDAAVSASKHGSLMPVVWIVIESGGLYVSTILAYLVASVAQSYSLFLVGLILNSMIGVTFTLLTVRVGLRRRTSSVQSSPAILITPHPVQPISITVRRETDVEKA